MSAFRDIVRAEVGKYVMGISPTLVAAEHAYAPASGWVDQVVIGVGGVLALVALVRRMRATLLRSVRIRGAFRRPDERATGRMGE